MLYCVRAEFLAGARQAGHRLHAVPENGHQVTTEKKEGLLTTCDCQSAVLGRRQCPPARSSPLCSLAGCTPGQGITLAFVADALLKVSTRAQWPPAGVKVVPLHLGCEVDRPDNNAGSLRWQVVGQGVATPMLPPHII